mmetsp:Transcript_39895/g.65387  ORF Transcript_39895/g.65387 Transcript_39895/m.65387 type:complete len:439 (-) Transcript_39895:1692-3008(-)
MSSNGTLTFPAVPETSSATTTEIQSESNTDVTEAKNTATDDDDAAPSSIDTDLLLLIGVLSAVVCFGLCVVLLCCKFCRRRKGRPHDAVQVKEDVDAKEEIAGNDEMQLVQSSKPRVQNNIVQYNSYQFQTIVKSDDEDDDVQSTTSKRKKKDTAVSYTGAEPSYASTNAKSAVYSPRPDQQHGQTWQPPQTNSGYGQGQRVETWQSQPQQTDSGYRPNVAAVANAHRPVEPWQSQQQPQPQPQPQQNAPYRPVSNQHVQQQFQQQQFQPQQKAPYRPVQNQHVQQQQQPQPQQKAPYRPVQNQHVQQQQQQWQPQQLNSPYGGPTSLSEVPRLPRDTIATPHHKPAHKPHDTFDNTKFVTPFALNGQGKGANPPPPPPRFNMGNKNKNAAFRPSTASSIYPQQQPGANEGEADGTVIGTDEEEDSEEQMYDSLQTKW